MSLFQSTIRPLPVFFRYLAAVHACGMRRVWFSCIRVDPTCARGNIYIIFHRKLHEINVHVCIWCIQTYTVNAWHTQYLTYNINSTLSFGSFAPPFNNWLKLGVTILNKRYGTVNAYIYIHEHCWRAVRINGRPDEIICGIYICIHSMRHLRTGIAWVARPVHVHTYVYTQLQNNRI